VFVSLVIQHAKRMRCMVICSMYVSTTFFYTVSSTALFSEKIFWKYVFRSLYSVCLQYFSFQEEVSKVLWQMYIGTHVKYPLFMSGFNETCIFSTDFRKIPKYHISQRSVLCELSCSIQTDRQKWQSNSRFSQCYERAQKCLEATCGGPYLKYFSKQT
jgi:hypothetical protein